MSTPALNKAEARQALLEIAEGWDKQKKIQHAIESYEAVIESDSCSKEADKARDALLKIAQRLEEEGKKHSAYHLYHKLADGKTGSHNRI